MLDSIKLFLAGSVLGAGAVGCGVACWLACGAAEPAPVGTTAPAVTEFDATPAATAPAVEAAPISDPRSPAWLKAKAGVTYRAPAKLPSLLAEKYEKYRTFEDAEDLEPKSTATTAEEREAELSDPGGPAPLFGLLRPGDKVISINGQPVPQGPQAGKALFEQLEGESRFSLVVERDGKRVVLSYSTDR